MILNALKGQAVPLSYFLKSVMNKGT